MLYTPHPPGTTPQKASTPYRGSKVSIVKPSLMRAPAIVKRLFDTFPLVQLPSDDATASVLEDEGLGCLVNGEGGHGEAVLFVVEEDARCVQLSMYLTSRDVDFHPRALHPSTTLTVPFLIVPAQLLAARTPSLKAAGTHIPSTDFRILHDHDIVRFADAAGTSSTAEARSDSGSSQTTYDAHAVAALIRRGVGDGVAMCGWEDGGVSVRRPWVARVLPEAGVAGVDELVRILYPGRTGASEESLRAARHAATRLRYDARVQALQEANPTDWADRVVDEFRKTLATVDAILASTAPHAHAQTGGRARSPVKGRRKTHIGSGAASSHGPDMGEKTGTGQYLFGATQPSLVDALLFSLLYPLRRAAAAGGQGVVVGEGTRALAHAVREYKHVSELVTRLERVYQAPT
ncbi:hypothetical protein PYCC9005_002209 [Savitreella phatthalungensis]